MDSAMAGITNRGARENILTKDSLASICYLPFAILQEVSMQQSPFCQGGFGPNKDQPLE